jgi:hypothetical protein
MVESNLTVGNICERIFKGVILIAYSMQPSYFSLLNSFFF